MKIGIVGLGYVGIQLAVGFGKKHSVIGFDLDQRKVDSYKTGKDLTGEITTQQLVNAASLTLTTDSGDLADCDLFIIAVPTPVDDARRPDFGPLIAASRTVGSVITAGATVVYESTVYPGATEEICVPVLESTSGLLWQRDFAVGYSPERINPGDPERTLATIIKVVSADNEKTLEMLVSLYGDVVTAGIHRAPSIRVAEAAKVIENTQRDLNIALINELASLFDKLDIDTHSVLEAAATKWNFLNFVPGLVGGHCIGVDPYYLTYKAQEVGHHPELISAGRRVNDAMPKFIADKLIRTLMKSKIPLQSTKILILGATFKENCPDLRNSKVIELVTILHEYGLEIDIFDPHISSEELRAKHDLRLSSEIKGGYNAILIAVKHTEFLDFTSSFLRSKLRTDGVIFDLKNTLPLGEADLRL